MHLLLLLHVHLLLLHLGTLLLRVSHLGMLGLSMGHHLLLVVVMLRVLLLDRSRLMLFLRVRLLNLQTCHMPSYIRNRTSCCHGIHMRGHHR
jgi:hypothetical protein